MLHFDRTDLDENIAPCDDFYQFANGGWLKKNPLPASEENYSSFIQLGNQTLKQLKNLIESAIHDTKKRKLPDYQKICDFYASGLHTGQLEKDSYNPLETCFAMISDIQNIAEVQDHITYMHKFGLTPAFRFYTAAYPKNSKKYEAYIFNGELALKNVKHYWDESAESSKIRKAYINFIEELLKSSPFISGNIKKNALEIFNFEAKLARIYYNEGRKSRFLMLSFEELADLSRSINWHRIFSNLGILSPERVIVSNTEFIESLNELMDDVPIATWKSYLGYIWIKTAAPFVSENCRQLHFHFFKHIVGGQQERKPLWESVTSTISTLLGELMGKFYIDEYFSKSLEASALELVNNLKEASEEIISNHPSLSPIAKDLLKLRLETIQIEIGYPQKWKDYKNLKISKRGYFQNVLNSMAFEMNLILSRLGKPVTVYDWDISPHSVNAYYNPLYNQIVIPAALFQAPYFSENGDKAMNYGAIGVIIAHEIIHAFQQTKVQDLGSVGTGKAISESDVAIYHQIESKLKQQLINLYPEVDSINHLGNSISENIADFGGLIIAVKAFEKHMTDNAMENQEDLSPWQRFFISYARIWAQNSSREELYRRTSEDVHSLPETRVKLPLPNIPQFVEAFNIESGSPMYIEKKQTISIS
ncbi:MAG: M13 family metallopeptidase [Bacteroidetes bacterium]|jgi:putative endopeptidase|nr:M13 family metallopeptidase [Bacteroidota bacterium]MBT4400322.1 M13 family metallopeptidase [Bacteroidota bacterium]MBT4408602.1 M13 family metallopeptidase [Bacteroidota bacterium]MBT7092088.1 M13 family metallopeptidase [Bacteroidota bacterium]MBT7462830.1 M13 family metallopeptidase [Bacteroidota bacterium]